MTVDIDVNSPLGQLQLLEVQRIEADGKQQELEMTKQRHSVLHDAIQDRLLEASMKPDQLGSQEIGSLLRETHSKRDCILLISTISLFCPMVAGFCACLD